MTVVSVKPSASAPQVTHLHLVPSNRVLELPLFADELALVSGRELTLFPTNAPPPETDALLRRHADSWVLVTRDPSLVVNRLTCGAVCLAVGMHVQLPSGIGITAENEGWSKVRELLVCLLDGPEIADKLRTALAAISMFLNGRDPLYLTGPERLPWIAAELHRAALPDHAFLVIDDKNAPSLAAAEAGATLCFTRRWPTTRLLNDIRDAGGRAIVCDDSVKHVRAPGSTIAVEPPARLDEFVPRLLRWTERALVSLGEQIAISEREFNCLVQLARPVCWSNYSIGEFVRRALALRRAPGVTTAAHRLGISHVALSRWLKRRRLHAYQFRCLWTGEP